MIGDIDDIDEMAEDEDGIDLFADNFERDYKARENDAYAGADIDDEETMMMSTSPRADNLKRA